MKDIARRDHVAHGLKTRPVHDVGRTGFPIYHLQGDRSARSPGIGQHAQHVRRVRPPRQLDGALRPVAEVKCERGGVHAAIGAPPSELTVNEGRYRCAPSGVALSSD